MGGTVHGLVNRRMQRRSGGNYDNSQNAYAAIAAFFNHLTTVAGGQIMTRVASNYGNGSGQDHMAGPNPCGTDYNIGVWKMNTSTLRPGGGTALGEVYFLVMMFGTSYYGSNFGVYIEGVNSSGMGATVAMAIAFREDGLSPWNGQTDDDGTDTFPNSHPWTDGAAGLHVLMPRSCNPGGSYNTNKNNLASVGHRYYYWDVTYGYFHGIADDDNIAIFITGEYGLHDTDDPKDFSGVMFGTGTVQPNAGSDPYCCYAMKSDALPIGMGGEYGDAGGTSTAQGGIKLPLAAGSGTKISAARFTTYAPIGGEYLSPNRYSSTGAIFEESGLLIYANNAADEGGWIGYGKEPGGDDFFRVVYAAPNEGYDVTNERAAIGRNSTNTYKTTVPWPIAAVGEAPGATRSLDGIAF